MRTFVSIIIFLFFLSVGYSQELNCSVEVVTPTLRITDPIIFQSLKTSIYEFMNGRSWTEDAYQEHEKIEMSILINVTEEISSERFGAQVTVQSYRPVFNSTYKSLMLNHIDEEFQFTYQQFQPLIYTENGYQNNLTSFLAFYAYLAISLDYESFAEKGGDAYINKMQNAVNNAQSSGERGWDANNSRKRNRFWIAENLTNGAYISFRNTFYKYHLRGLDAMYQDAKRARKSVIECLEELKELNDNFRNLIILRLFFNAKQDELVGIFSEAPEEEQKKAIELLSELDPTNVSKYRKIGKK